MFDNNFSLFNDSKVNVSDQSVGRLFEIWKNYKKISIHFNGLIFRLRTLSLAGLTGVFTLLLSSGKFTDGSSNSKGGLFLIFIASMLVFLWIALWFLDCLYYNRLLLGTVVELLELEKKMKDASGNFDINLTHQIKDSVGNFPKDLKRNFFSSGVNVFYLIVLLVLIDVVIYGCYLVSACNFYALLALLIPAFFIILLSGYVVLRSMKK